MFIEWFNREEQELEMIELYHNGISAADVAKQFGCSRRSIYHFAKKHGKSKGRSMNGRKHFYDGK